MTSSVHPKYKTKYHVGNWPAYDRALVQRGDITVWLAPDAIATWEAVGVGKRGGQLQYSDLAIETALTLRLIFHLPLRQTAGFLTSILRDAGSRPVRARSHHALPAWPASRPPASSRPRRCWPTSPRRQHGPLDRGRGCMGRGDTWRTGEARLEDAASRCRPIGCDRRPGPDGGERRCCMNTRCGWGGVARTSRDPPQEPHYGDEVEGSSQV